ncbi:OsmC family protein [Pseudomonas sp. LRF_L74]|uniref:OsmC family protein n=1 Tax=Pseudomonas sp. LRF_L74 TaxID=3369422 RepID=UPI003F609A4D
MAKLDAYLKTKKAALAARQQQRLAHVSDQPSRLSVRGGVAGASGVRTVQLGKHVLLSDSPEEAGGHGLAPSAIELQLGALAACVVHTALIQAAKRDISLEDVNVDVTAAQYPLAREAGTPFADTPNYPQQIAFHLRLVSSASDEQLQALFGGVLDRCPIIQLLGKAGEVAGEWSRG